MFSLVNDNIGSLQYYHWYFIWLPFNIVNIVRFMIWKFYTKKKVKQAYMCSIIFNILLHILVLYNYSIKISFYLF